MKPNSGAQSRSRLPRCKPKRLPRPCAVLPAPDTPPHRLRDRSPPHGRPPLGTERCPARFTQRLLY